jgi:hypothetical protein
LEAQESGAGSYRYDDFPQNINTSFLIYVLYESGCLRCPDCCALVHVEFNGGKPKVDTKVKCGKGCDDGPPDPGPAKGDVRAMFDGFSPTRYSSVHNIAEQLAQAEASRGAIDRMSFAEANTTSASADPLLQWGTEVISFR